MTLLEVIMATVIFSVLAMALASASRIANGSKTTITEVISANETQREAASLLMDELKSTSDALITVTVLADGNHEIDFQLPLVVGAALVWGVGTEVDWHVRYTVRTVVVGENVDRRLVRQVWDDVGVLQSEDVLATGLPNGAANPPGFQVIQVGVMWEVTLTTDSQGIRQGRRTSFHVRTRN